MSDTSGVGDYQNPVKFDFAVPVNLTGGARLIHGANRGLMPASALEALSTVRALLRELPVWIIDCGGLVWPVPAVDGPQRR